MQTMIEGEYLFIFWSLKTVSKVPSAFFPSLMKICLNFFYFYVNSFCVWCAIAGGGLGRSEETGKKVDISNFDIGVHVYNLIAEKAPKINNIADIQQ